MKINVAGAGAGKTTGLASQIIEKHTCTPEHKNIYCVAFTKSAAESIREKLTAHYGTIPRNIIIGTIHSFLYQEFISPFYYLLYKKHYQSISSIDLPTNQLFKQKKLSELEQKSILHVEKIPERAKWVVAKKSSNNAQEKAVRKTIMNMFCSYCSTIYVDEAQDIDSNMKVIFSALDGAGIELILYGDPKQDIRGFGCFREMITTHTDNTSYISTCHRCPKEHLLLSNSLVRPEERQYAEKAGGQITLLFESDCTTDINLQMYDLKYIYKKNDRFDTHAHTNEKSFDNLYYEVHSILALLSKESDKFAIKITSYKFAQLIMRWRQSGKTVTQAIASFCDYTGRLEKAQYAKLCDAASACCMISHNRMEVSSIESVKGLEGERCLFILTSDLAAYLMRIKTDENRTKNALYVALTRSLRLLTILICKEVEEEYGRSTINDFFMKYIN